MLIPLEPACDRPPSVDCDERPAPEDHHPPKEQPADPSELLKTNARLIRTNYQVLARANAVLRTAAFRPGC